MAEFMETHDESEVCVIQIDYNDLVNDDRVDYWGVSAWPTIVGNGLADVWPIDCIEGDYEANYAIPSPLEIFITEDGMSHLPHHVKVFMTPPTSGESFAIGAGETISITKTFQVEPGWDYSLMGVVQVENTTWSEVKALYR